MSSLQGTGQLVRFALRRDRIWLSVWVLAIVAVLVGSAASVIGLYPDQASLDQAAALIQGNSTVIALNGPAQGLDNVGGRVMFEIDHADFTGPRGSVIPKSIADRKIVEIVWLAPHD